MNLRDAYRILELAREEYKRIHLECERQKKMIARQREYLAELSCAFSPADGDGPPDEHSTNEAGEHDNGLVAVE